MPIVVAKAAVVRVTPVGPRPHVQPATVTATPISPGAELVAVPQSAVDMAVGKAVATQITIAGQAQTDSNMGHMATGWAYENQHVTTLARVMLPNGVAATQSDVSSITRNIYDIAEQNSTTLQGSSLTVSDVIFNALQIDGYWGVDTSGYNLRDTATFFADTTTGGGKYRIEYELNTSSHGDIFVVSEVVMRPVYRQ